MKDIFESPIIPICFDDISSSDLMKTIQKTNQQIKRTKIYVQNIPIKSNFTSHRESIFEEICQNQSPVKKQQDQNSSSGYQRSGYSKYSQRKFNKSGTPFERLSDFQFDDDEIKETNSPIKSIIKIQESEHLVSRQKVQKQQQNNPSQYQHLTFRMENKQHLQNNKQPKNNLLQIQIDNKKQSKSSQRTTPKARSPLNKTFEIYQSYLSSNPSSTKSGKKTHQLKNQQFVQNDKILSAEEIVNYFKKKDQRQNQSLGGEKIKNDHQVREKRCQRERMIHETLLKGNSTNVNQKKSSSNCNQKINTPSKKYYTNMPINPFKSIEEQYEEGKMPKKTMVEQTQGKIIKNQHRNEKRNNEFNKDRGQKKSIQQSTVHNNQGTVKKLPYKPMVIEDQYDSNDRRCINQYEINIDENRQNTAQRDIKPSEINKSLQKQVNNERRNRHSRKHGIKVLLSTPERMKVTEIQYEQRKKQSPQQQYQKEQQRSKQPSVKKRYLQISIRSSNSLEKLQKAKEKNKQQNKSGEVIIETKQSRKEKDNKQKGRNKKGNYHSVTNKIYAQLDKLQALNRRGNKIQIDDYDQNGEKENQKQSKQQQLFYHQHQKDNQQLHYQRHRQMQYQLLKKETPQKSKYLTERKNKQSIKDKNLKINEINNITIYPSHSLEKYQQSLSSSVQKQQQQQFSPHQSQGEIVDNILAFTPQKRHKLQTKLPFNHIQRLQRSIQSHQMASLQSSQQKTTSRKKIFNHFEQKKLTDQLQKGLKDTERIKKIFQKQIINHNKSLESKLYNFLVQEDVNSGKRGKQSKNIYLSPRQNTNKPMRQVSRKIFNTEERRQVKKQRQETDSPQSSENNSNFKYKQLNQHENSLLHRSFESFEDTLRAQSKGKNSVNSSIQKSLLNKFNSTENNKAKRRLQQDEIRNQIRKIKQYDFIERYMTNFELENLMRKYINEGIPARKWSLMVIDQVYNKIREKKQRGTK